tara:strand:- start:1046 stop:1228 length:183 start_codon:yes stop_codon:yes gene_type:complete
MTALTASVLTEAASKSDIDEAFIVVQDFLGVTDGGIAGMFATGNPVCEDWAGLQVTGRRI